jgi:hypothetical protein
VRRRLLLAILVAGCSLPSRQEQLGVEVFSVDTIPVHFSLTMSGGIELRVDAERAFRQGESSLVFETPARLYVARGSGQSTIAALERDRRLVVQPIGVSADSAERAAVVGSAVQITRPRDEPRLALEVSKP